MHIQILGYKRTDDETPTIVRKFNRNMEPEARKFSQKLIRGEGIMKVLFQFINTEEAIHFDTVKG